MLLVLRLYPVWRWNAEALKVATSFAATSTHRQDYRAVFLFSVDSVNEGAVAKW
jgi:hypothetical protein